jgi:hypothetical protein
MIEILIGQIIKEQLVTYITNCFEHNQAINVPVKISRSKYSKFLMKHTRIPSVLIKIISSYTDDKINIYITRYVLQAYGSTFFRNIHTHFVIFANNIIIDYVPYSFSFTYCFDYKYDHWLDNCLPIIEYSCPLSRCYVDNDTFMCIISKCKKRFENHEGPKAMSEFLEKVCFVNPNHYFKTYDDLNNRSIDACCESVDFNIFFNSYLQETQNNSKINCNNSVIGKYILEKCKCTKHNESGPDYEHIAVKRYVTTSIHYKIINHEKVTNTIIIIKTICEIINEQMKKYCSSDKIRDLIENMKNHMYVDDLD